MEGVKVALGNRGMTMEATRARPESPGAYLTASFTRLLLLGPVFFRTALPCSGGYHIERGVMPLHDAVGINCKNGATTENQCAGVKYMG